jgi:hypothetical protein
VVAAINDAGASREIRSEARGGHWVAWVPDADGKPMRSVVLIGETRQVAEERARRLAERLAGAPAGS